MTMGCPVSTDVKGVVCGGPPFVEGSRLCEKHYAYKFPVTYARLKREVKCEECLGKGVIPNYEKDGLQEPCTKCDGRGWVDPTRGKGTPP